MPAPDTRPEVAPDKLRLGLILPTWTTNDLMWSEILEVAQTAADVGFDALYVSDHLLIPSNNAELKRRAGVDFPDDPDVDLEGWEQTLCEIERRRPARLALPHFGVAEDTEEHLARMRAELARAAERVRSGMSPEELTGRFRKAVNRSRTGARFSVILSQPQLHLTTAGHHPIGATSLRVCICPRSSGAA